MPIQGGTYKKISASDIKVRKTSLNQLVDIIQEDISGSNTRRKYQVFVTGGVGPGVTSSLYQTVYDQNFTLQTANPLFDLTVGLRESTAVNTAANATTTDAAGKRQHTSQSCMIREKQDIYKQYAAYLLGDSSKTFAAPFGSATSSDEIDYALFLSMKRLFTRDGMKKNTFAVKINRSGSAGAPNQDGLDGDGRSNIYLTSTSGSTIFTDSPSEGNFDYQNSSVGDIKNADNADEKAVGTIFYNKGIVVLDMQKVFSGSQKMSGTIPALSTSTTIDGASIAAGSTVLGSSAGNASAKFIPDFVCSSSIDTIIDHIASTRFQSGSLTAMTFQNKTDINSTLIFCRATADEFNYSSNPTFTDPTSGRIVVIDENQEDVQRSFTFPTTVGLHDAFGNTLAVAKFSRPIEKNDEKDITFRIRLDF